MSITGQVRGQGGRSFIWLLIGAALLVVSNGRWVAPPAAWLAPVFLIRFLRTQKAGVGLVIGGVAYIGISLVSWLHMLMTGGWDSGSFLFVTLMAAAMYLPYVVDRLAAPRLHGLASTLVFPLAWVAMEYLKSLFSPFATFSDLSYTQFGFLPLVQLASVTGIWGISFMVTWLAGVVNLAWAQHHSWYDIRRSVITYMVAVIVVIVAGGVRTTVWAPGENTVRVATVTTGQEFMDRRRAAETLDDYRQVRDDTFEFLLDRTRRAARAGAEVVIWQEYAVSLVENEDSLYERAGTVARDENIYLGLAYGTLWRNRDGRVAGPDDKKPLPPENKVAFINPHGRLEGVYLKAHPIPIEHITPGDGVIPVYETPHGQIATVICFDAEIPSYVRRTGIDILLVPSMDWREIDPLNTHTTMFRAVENGFSLVRGTGQGRAMAVDYQGRVLSALDYYNSPNQNIMIADVPVGGTTTVYSRIGDFFAWLSLAGLLAVVIAAIRRREE